MRQALKEKPLKTKKNGGLKIKFNGFSLDLDKRVYIAGILNVTPDSFSDGGKYIRKRDAVNHALNMARSGADIIDVGGESTRPASMPVSAEEELDRIIPVIERLKRSLDVPISIDTYKAEVAEEALKRGASIVNDITGLKGDANMAAVVAGYGAPIVIMHIKGTPRTMQEGPCYQDLIGEVTAYLKESIGIAKARGIDEKKIIIDPGIGFGKKLEHNLKIIRELHKFKAIGRPIMVGPSRKSFIGQILRCETDERLMGTAAAVAMSVSNGANIIRVHDVRQMREVVRIAESICRD